MLYAPPDGIGPAQAKYIYSETIDRETYVATLMYAAEKEAVDLTRDGDTWTIKDHNGPAGWAELDPVTLGSAHILGGPGSSFTANKKDVAAGQRLKDEIALFDDSVKNWAEVLGQPGHQRARRPGRPARPRRLRRRAGRRDLEPLLDDDDRPDPRRRSPSAASR